MENVLIVDHPLVQHKLTYLRQRKTSPKEFRSLVEELTILMLYEATRSLPLVGIEIETPVGKAQGNIIAGKKLAFVAILRAGLGMVSGGMRLMPSAKVGHVGVYRDEESLQPVVYYRKLPSDLHQRECIVLDTMLATGGTAIETVNLLKLHQPSSIKFITLIASKEGLNAMVHSHPDIEVYLAALDSQLDARGFIVPGLGDAGDRLFETD